MDLSSLDEFITQKDENSQEDGTMKLPERFQKLIEQNSTAVE